jgi:HemY protein
MIKRLLIYFLVLIAATWIGLEISDHSGYVLIAYKNVRIETTLWFAILTTLIFFLAFYILLKINHRLWHLPKTIKVWYANYQQRKAHNLTIAGWIALIEKKWRIAEKKLLRASKRTFGNAASLCYLIASYAAQQQNSQARRDIYLNKAYKINKKHPLIVSLAQIQLQITNQQWEEALAALQILRKTQPKHIAVIELLYQVYLNLQDWENLKLLLPLLRKYKILSKEIFKNLQLTVYNKLLGNYLKTHQLDSFSQLWRQLPRPIRKQPELLSIYIKFLIAQGDEIYAGKLLHKALQRTWDAKLIEQYCQLTKVNPLKQLKLAESFLRVHGEDAILLLNLGRLCNHLKLWGKAKSYLETSLKINPSVETYNELGHIMEQQGDIPAALNYYRTGLQIRTTSVTGA